MKLAIQSSIPASSLLFILFFFLGFFLFSYDVVVVSFHVYVCMSALKAGGCGFESHLSSLFSMKIEKRALRFVALPCL